MARTVALVLAIAFVLSACIPSVFPEGPTAAPVIDTPTVDEGLAATMVAATLNALPTSTLESATVTFTLPPTLRKTANVILAELFQEPMLAVDTHVFRVGFRLGLHQEKTPEKAEQELLKVIDRQYLPAAHHWFILHRWRLYFFDHDSL